MAPRRRDRRVGLVAAPWRHHTVGSSARPAAAPRRGDADPRVGALGAARAHRVGRQRARDRAVGRAGERQRLADQRLPRVAVPRRPAAEGAPVPLEGDDPGRDRPRSTAGATRSGSRPGTASGIGPKSSATPPTWTRWYPAKGATWQWQLTTPVNTAVNVGVYDIDMFDNSPAVVARLHQLGHKVICYVDVGSWENFRPDKAKFPASVLGTPLDGFSDERWLDIRKISVLAPIIKARFAGVQEQGLRRGRARQRRRLRRTRPASRSPQPTSCASTRGSPASRTRWGSVSRSKNDLDQVGQLVTTLRLRARRAVLRVQGVQRAHAVHRGQQGRVRSRVQRADVDVLPDQARALGFSSMKKNLDLDASRQAC